MTETKQSQSRLCLFGPTILSPNSVRFEFFAPAADAVTLSLPVDGRALPMNADGDGWHTIIAQDAGAGTRYCFVLPDGQSVPDPASRFQPEDIHAPSEVIDASSFMWQAAEWRGRPWEEVVLYELHVGTFTPQGTFAAATGKLDHLAELGVTAIELMCVADFAGNRNWGYDGVLWFAPDSAYGRPEEMMAFVDAAHRRSIMVILDVVYNHFGPEGNRMPEYFPAIASERHETPWGRGLNFDGKGSHEVREFVLQNAVYWIETFRLDGLRLDASHAMVDESPEHILDELRGRVLACAGARRVHLILENEVNIAKRLVRTKDGAQKGFSAQWNHDITHLLSAILGKGCEERRTDDAGETNRLGKALARGFVNALEESGGLEIRDEVPPTAFIAFIQTHDLIGNRVFGERISAIASTQSIRAIAVIYLLAPQIPMLFMGEEWAASTPFPFFSDYHGSLAEDVRRGRCEELAKLDPAPTADELKRAPNPQAESTLRSAQLRWEELRDDGHAQWLAWYRAILKVRRERIVPAIAGLSGTCGTYSVIGPGALEVRWRLCGGQELLLATNLCEQPTQGFTEERGTRLWLQGEAEGTTLRAWSVRWTIADLSPESPDCE